MNKEVEKLMKLLHISEEEALQVIEDDKAIDRGETMYFDLSKEEEKLAKKWANVGEKTVKTTEKEKKTTKKTVTRKENPTKSTIIAEVTEFLRQKGYENVEITNKERQIAFKIDDNDFELTLVQKRKAKK